MQISEFVSQNVCTEVSVRCMKTRRVEQLASQAIAAKENKGQMCSPAAVPISMHHQRSQPAHAEPQY